MTIHFDSSIVKIDKDGRKVLSSVLDKGERLIDGRTYRQLVRESAPKHAATTAARPLDSASKEVWYAYAQSKGFAGDYEGTTKAEFITQFGA